MTLDVTFLLSDPDFITPGGITVTRSKQTVTRGGIVESTQTVFYDVKAVVIVNDDLALGRTPDGAQLLGTITIYSKFRFLEDGNGYSADIVTWHRESWVVVNSGDWSQYGEGYYKAVLSLLRV